MVAALLKPGTGGLETGIFCGSGGGLQPPCQQALRDQVTAVPQTAIATE
jgi:hypothetical protein